MPQKTHRVLGLMSGSSLDGLDVAYCVFKTRKEDSFAVESWEIAVAETMPYTKEWQEKLAELIEQKANLKPDADMAQKAITQISNELEVAQNLLEKRQQAHREYAVPIQRVFRVQRRGRPP